MEILGVMALVFISFCVFFLSERFYFYIKYVLPAVKQNIINTQNLFVRKDKDCLQKTEAQRADMHKFVDFVYDKRIEDIEKKQE